MQGRVRITEVAPRDGLQNEPHVIPTAQKATLVRLLANSGVDEIEVSSFVSPRWIPQLADATQLFELLQDSKPQHLIFSALVPNEKGLEAALNVNHRAARQLIDKVSVFTAASESFSKKNTNATIAETLERFEPVIKRAQNAHLQTRAYISCVIACPFEGPTDPDKVTTLAKSLLDLGVDEIDLGDTIGAATTESTRHLLEHTRQQLPDTPLTLHFHDTFNRAADCVRTALNMGVRSFDAAAGGMGGCPYASTPDRRAPGNIDTQTLIKTIQSAGFQSSADINRLAQAGEFARQITSPSTTPTNEGPRA